MMKTWEVAAILLTLGIAAGCNGPSEQFMGRSGDDAALVRIHQDDGIRNAVIAQHTLFPYHFVADGAALNELGRQDLAILVDHFGGRAGRLNVRAGDVGPELRQERVQAVVDAMKAGGLQAESVVIADGLPAGEWMASERVVQILDQQDQERSGTSGSADSTTTSGL
jgi:hypothetical protein